MHIQKHLSLDSTLAMYTICTAMLSSHWRNQVPDVPAGISSVPSIRMSKEMDGFSMQTDQPPFSLIHPKWVFPFANADGKRQVATGSTILLTHSLLVIELHE